MNVGCSILITLVFLNLHITQSIHSIRHLHVFAQAHQAVAVLRVICAVLCVPSVRLCLT